MREKHFHTSINVLTWVVCVTCRLWVGRWCSEHRPLPPAAAVDSLSSWRWSSLSGQSRHCKQRSVGNGVISKHFSVLVEVSRFSLSIPAVDNNRSHGGSRPSVCLDVGHQLQQRHCWVGGFVVRPWCVPVMLQHAGLIPTLRTHTFKHIGIPSTNHQHKDLFALHHNTETTECVWKCVPWVWGCEWCSVHTLWCCSPTLQPSHRFPSSPANTEHTSTYRDTDRGTTLHS